MAQGILERDVQMSRIFISIILLMTMGFSGCKTPIPETTDEDGGISKYETGNDSPKTIESTEIVSFVCEFSQIAIMEEDSALAGKVYTLSAILENETVTGKIKWHDRYGEGNEHKFTTDSSFMIKLQEIVSKYNFAQYNGYSYKVSGIPDQYGSMLDIKYASGKCIYGSDNQSCFLSLEAMDELVILFTLWDEE